MKEINLLPWKDQQNKREDIKFIIFFLLAIFLSFLMIFFLNELFYHQVNQLDLHKAGLVKRLSFLSLSINELQQIEQQSKQLKTTYQLLNNNHKKIQEILRLLHRSCMNMKIFIKTIDYQSPYFSILISVSSEKKFLELIEKIEKKYHWKYKYLFQKKQDSKFEFLLKMEP
ncbi:MAG: hypothetical protein V4700_02625 [Pseudomonadota bacterium]